MVEKRTIGGDGRFDFTGNLPGAGSFSLTTVNGVTSTTFSNVLSGTYSISETAPAGWVLTSAACDNGGNPASISLTSGQTVKCTFENTKLGKITVVKQAVGGDATFNFSGDLGGFTIKTASGSGKQDLFDVAPGTYALVEAPTAGWDLTDAICTDGSAPAAIDLSAGGVFQLRAERLRWAKFGKADRRRREEIAGNANTIVGHNAAARAAGGHVDVRWRGVVGRAETWAGVASRHHHKDAGVPGVEQRLVDGVEDAAFVARPTAPGVVDLSLIHISEPTRPY